MRSLLRKGDWMCMDATGGNKSIRAVDAFFLDWIPDLKFDVTFQVTQFLPD
jgi:hypothetical protein